MIELRGLRALVRLGATAEERAAPQPVELDVDLVVDVGEAAASDDLAATVDYGAVVAAVAAAVGAGEVALLERLAALAGDAALGVDPRIEAVEVVVRKLRPPVPADLATAGVRVRRTR